ncbi:MAG: hypothetical protein KJN76_00630 [Eudoraea sp.]|nr:hypothetical protein [Eudoraea sp.]
MELLAALAGSFYLSKTNATRISKQLVAFLWITFFVEVIASYAPIAYFSEFKYFAFVKDTPFENNKWLYNIYTLYSYVFLAYYFHQNLRNLKWRLILKVILVAFTVVAVFNLVFSGVFFTADAQFTLLTGTLILVLSIILFYFELLQSDLILQLKRLLPMYISVGVLIFNLCVTPVDIFSEYFSEENVSFIALRNNVYLYTNVFMYAMFIIGFLICSREKTSY